MLDTAIRDARVNNRNREVVVSTIYPFAHFCLVPHFCEPNAADKPFHLRVSIKTELTDFKDDTDLAVRFGPGRWADVKSIPIWPEWVQPVCHPRIKPAKTQVNPEHLLDFTLIHVRSDYAWHRWFQAHHVPFVIRQSDLVFDCQILALDAVKAGLGFGLNRPLIDAIVREEQLYTDHFDRVPLDVGYHLVRPLYTALREPAVAFARHFLTVKGKSRSEIDEFLANPHGVRTLC